MVLWRKSHVSNWSHFKAYRSSLYEKRNAVYFLQISLFIPEIFKFLKYANCSNVLQKVQHNMSLKVLLHGNILGSKPPQYWRHFWPPSAFYFYICKWCLVCMTQQAYKYISSSLWPCLAFFQIKITNILKLSGWGLGQSELPWELNFYSRRCVSYRTISLPSFNELRCKFAKITLFMHLR